MSSFVSTLALEFPLSESEQEVLLVAYRWVITYSRMMNADSFRCIPEPKGTVFEAWTILNMATMLWGFQMFPTMQVRLAVPTPADHLNRMAALIRRLEVAPSAEGECVGRTLSE